MVAEAQLLACRFLVIANGMAACYSLLQGARCLVSILTGGVLINRPMAWAIFSCDQASTLIYNCHYQLLYFFGRCLYVLACVLFITIKWLLFCYHFYFYKYFEWEGCCSVALEHLNMFCTVQTECDGDIK